MKFDLDKNVDRFLTASEKWDCVEKYYPKAKAGALPLWVADMDFACAPAIQKALHDRIDREIYGYTDSDYQPYKDAVHDWFLRRFAWDINVSDMYYSPGVVPALAYLLKILSKEGDGIIIQEPVYHPFARNIKNLKRVVASNELVNDDGIYTIDFEDLKQKFADPNNVGMILCSPHNPVGRVWNETELNTIVDLAVQYDKWIISDEIHCDLIRANKTHIPLAKLRPDALDHIITCTAPSKTFNIAGLKNSNIIISNKAYQALWEEEIMKCLCIHEPNAFAQLATIAAYQESEDWVNEVNHYIDENIAYVTQVFQEHLPQAILSPCEGTYLMWIDMRAYCGNEIELEDKMQKEAGVLCDEGYIFGDCGKGFERLNVACPRSILNDACERIIHTFK